MSRSIQALHQISSDLRLKRGSDGGALYKCFCSSNCSCFSPFCRKNTTIYLIVIYNQHNSLTHRSSNHTPLFKQLRKNQQEAQDNYDEMTKAMRGSRALERVFHVRINCLETNLQITRTSSLYDQCPHDNFKRIKHCGTMSLKSSVTRQCEILVQANFNLAHKRENTYITSVVLPDRICYPTFLPRSWRLMDISTARLTNVQHIGRNTTSFMSKEVHFHPLQTQCPSM